MRRMHLLRLFRFSFLVPLVFGMRGPVGWAQTPEGSSVAIHGRIRSVSMTRDYEGNGTGANSSLGVLLHAEAVPLDGMKTGATYIQAEEVVSRHQSDMLSNNDIRIVNEAWVAFEPEGSVEVRAGRMIVNGEVFRKDDSRQKPRAVEAVELRHGDLTAGHALRMSNYLQSGDRWRFNSFDDVFKVDQESAGLSWVEAVVPATPGIRATVYDAYVWDVLNLVGARVDWRVAGDLTITGYARIESGIGDSEGHRSETYGLSSTTGIKSVTLESGVLAVRGDNMKLQETTTGFNHALASCMIIYACPFDGGADTYYLKATTPIGKFSLYGLGMYSRHSEQPFDAFELDVVVKRPLTEHVDFAAKAAVAQRDHAEGENTTATDARLFLTYAF